MVKPVTKKAKPTCMNNTMKPVMSSHVKLIEIARWPVVLASALIPTCESSTFFTPDWAR